MTEVPPDYGADADPVDQFSNQLQRSHEVGELQGRIEMIAHVETALADAVEAGWLDRDVAINIRSRITEPEAQVVLAKAKRLGVEL